jgi:hypothetical protein
VTASCTKPVIPATREAEIGRTEAGGQLGKWSSRPHLQNHQRDGGVAQAVERGVLSSNPITPRKGKRSKKGLMEGLSPVQPAWGAPCKTWVQILALLCGSAPTTTSLCLISSRATLGTMTGAVPFWGRVLTAQVTWGGQGGGQMGAGRGDSMAGGVGSSPVLTEGRGQQAVVFGALVVDSRPHPVCEGQRERERDCLPASLRPLGWGGDPMSARHLSVPVLHPPLDMSTSFLLSVVPGGRVKMPLALARKSPSWWPFVSREKQM